MYILFLSVCCCFFAYVYSILVFAYVYSILVLEHVYSIFVLAEKKKKKKPQKRRYFCIGNRPFALEQKQPLAPLVEASP